MPVEIDPEPSEDERAAILVALERLLADEAHPAGSAWWQAGLRGNLDDEEDL